MPPEADLPGTAALLPPPPPSSENIAALPATAIEAGSFLPPPPLLPAEASPGHPSQSPVATAPGRAPPPESVRAFPCSVG